MNAQQEELGHVARIVSPLAIRPFASLRKTMTRQEIAHVRFVYFASWDLHHITLCATPVIAGRVVDVSPRLRRRLLQAFLRWMAHVQPEWRDGLDAGGVLDWDIARDAITHRHSGFRQQFVRSRIEADTLDALPVPHHEPAMSGV